MKNEIKIIQPDDWHVHFREGEMLKAITHYSSRVNKRCIAMPNTDTPITDSAKADNYRSEIIKNSHNPSFQIWKNEFLENFGLSLANVIDILDPDVIVLGGGLSNIPFLYDEGKNAVYDKVFSDIIDTPIIKNELGDSAGVFGACLL